MTPVLTLFIYDMNRIIVLVAIGGLLGSVARYLGASYIAKLIPSAFPYGTLTINVIGCLLIGIIYGIANRYEWFTPELRFFLATGFCGGFTTFSSFALENLQLLQNGNYAVFCLYSLSSYALGLGAVTLGYFISKI